MAGQTFAELQAQFRTIWPTVTLRSIGDVERTVVVVHSISFDVPDQLIPVFPAYEERFLCLVLSLLRAPRSRVIYVTSQPIHPRVADYYFSLVPELDTPEAREPVRDRLARRRPQRAALAEAPGAARRSRAHPAAHRRARGGLDHPLLHDRRGGRARRGAQLPIYGCDPDLGWLGSKTGSRRVFADENVQHPVGLDVRATDDLAGRAGRAAGSEPGTPARRSSSSTSE